VLGSPSSQAVSSDSVWHVVGKAQPAPWQASTPRQRPKVQVSRTVPGSPSSQSTPSGAGKKMHCPVATEQKPGRWQGPGGGQTPPVQGALPVQVPPQQASPVVLGLPSSHGVPSSF
jgi:hypothetical protein